MRVVPALGFAAIGLLVLSGCTYLTERNDAALGMTVIDACSDVPPPELDVDTPPAVDGPRMYGSATVTNGFTREYDFTVRVDVFTLDGDRVGRLVGWESNIAPGESVSVRISGDLWIPMPSEGIECRLDRVVVEGI